MTNEIATPATKQQLDALIGVCLDGKYTEAAGLLQLASDMLSNAVHTDSRPVFCCCLEHAGDRLDCPIHGQYYHNDSDFSDSDIRDHAGIYSLGMGC